MYGEIEYSCLKERTKSTDSSLDESQNTDCKPDEVAFCGGYRRESGMDPALSGDMGHVHE